jgi:hypothetical protein
MSFHLSVAIVKSEGQGLLKKSIWAYRGGVFFCSGMPPMESNSVSQYMNSVTRLGNFGQGKERQMTLSRINPEMITSLKRELQHVRQQSLQATRQGDFMKVARLTTVAAQLNKSIMDAEGELLAQG